MRTNRKADDKSMNTKQKPRLSERRLRLPKKFTPKLFDEADNRYFIVKELKRRCERLMIDTAADSMQKRMLCQEAVFVGVQLESLRKNAAEGQEIDMGSYTQLVNCLQGLLGKLGLDKQFKSQMSDLESYLKGKRRRTGNKRK